MRNEKTILVTVGTSLFSNYKRMHINEPCQEELLRFLKSTAPESASAETNSLNKLLDEHDSIVFLHSQTEKGQLCAKVLKRYYEKKGYKVELSEIQELSYEEKRFKMRGLRALVSILIDYIQKRENVIINATGGFKAEIAYATLVGLLFKVPVYYIHEAFQEIIQMPPTPIHWDFSFMLDHEEFFQWLLEDLRTLHEVENKLKTSQDVLRFFLEDEEEQGEIYVTLSPAGYAFYRAYKDEIERADLANVYLSSKAADYYRGLDETQKKKVISGLQKLYVPTIRKSKSRMVNNCDCFVFLRGAEEFRFFYYETDGKLYICEIARHKDETYDHLLDKGVYRENYRGFEPWSRIEKR